MPAKAGIQYSAFSRKGRDIAARDGVYWIARLRGR